MRVYIYSLSCCDPFGGAMASRARETRRRSGRCGRGKRSGASRERKPIRCLLFLFIFFTAEKHRHRLSEVSTIPFCGNYAGNSHPRRPSHRCSPLSTSRVARVGMYVRARTYLRALCAFDVTSENQREREKRRETGNGARQIARERARHDDAKRIHVGGGGDGDGERRNENKGGRKRSPRKRSRERSIDGMDSDGCERHRRR